MFCGATPQDANGECDFYATALAGLGVKCLRTPKNDPEIESMLDMEDSKDSKGCVAVQLCSPDVLNLQGIPDSTCSGTIGVFVVDAHITLYHTKGSDTSQQHH